MIVIRPSANVTLVCSTAVTSPAREGLRGATVTTVSRRSLATSSRRAACKAKLTSMGVGVLNVGMVVTPFRKVPGVPGRPAGWRDDGCCGASVRLARPPRVLVGCARLTRSRAAVLRVDGVADRTDQPRIDGESVGGGGLVDPRLQLVGQTERRARGADVVEVGGVGCAGCGACAGGDSGCGGRAGRCRDIRVVGRPRRRDHELQVAAAEADVDGAGSELAGDL